MSNKTKAVSLILVCSLFICGIFLLYLFYPSPDFSESERRSMADFPELSIDNIMSGKFTGDFEDYASDRFPFRDFFRRIKAFSVYKLFSQKDNNGIYTVNGSAAKLEYPLNEEKLLAAAEIFRNIYEQYLLSDAGRVYFSIIPDKNFFLAEKKDMLSLDYERLVKIMRENTEFMEYIDIFPLLDEEDYYKTDTHWRQEKISDVANALLSAMGAEFEPFFETKKLDKAFYGVYYGQSAMPLDGEELFYLTSPLIEGSLLEDFETGDTLSLYNMEKAYGKDAYEMFLSGSKSLLRIKNPASQNERRLIIFRDSYASSIAPLMTAAYSEITLIDIRYINMYTVKNFIDLENSDVLFLYSSLVLNNSETLKR